MGLKIIKERSGELRRVWYGRFFRGGTTVDIKLDVGAIKGEIPLTPAGTWDRHRKGDKAFEESKAEALKAFRAKVKKSKERREELAKRDKERRIYEGDDAKSVPLSALFRKWKDDNRATLPTALRQTNVRRAFEDFANFTERYALKRGVAITTLDHVTRDLATAFLDHLRTSYSWDTAKNRFAILRTAWKNWATKRDRVNPFGEIKGRPGKRRSDVGSATAEIGVRVPRKALLPDQLKKLFALLAEHDARLFDLAACAATTGLRFVDVVNLKWSDVRLEKSREKIARGEYGFISGEEEEGFETSKTGAKVFLPILEPFNGVLRRLAKTRDDRDVYIFPEALERYNNPNTRRQLMRSIKPFFALAVRDDKEKEIEDVREEPTLEHTLDAIAGACFMEKKAKRLELVAKAHFAGLNQTSIAKDLGESKAKISGDFDTLEEITGRDFRAKARRQRLELGASRRSLIRETQTTRAVGKCAASRYDWHSFRSTFVVFAVLAGVPLPIVSKTVGHSTTKITLEHYFNPQAKHEAAIISKAVAGVYALEMKRPDDTPPEALPKIEEKKLLTADEEIANLSEAATKKLRRQLLEEMNLI